MDHAGGIRVKNGHSGTCAQFSKCYNPVRFMYHYLITACTRNPVVQESVPVPAVNKRTPYGDETNPLAGAGLP